MSGRGLTAGNYGLDDVDVGDRIDTAEAAISAAMIDRFADLTGDRFRIHMSEEGAAEFGFPARVAHGLLVLSVVDGLKNQAPAQFRAVASLGWTWSFQRPVLAGDTIRAVIVVEAKRATSDGRRGILDLAFEVTNQRGEPVQAGRNQLMVQR